MTSEPRIELDGLAYVECPRWHDGRLWFAHWGTDEIIALDANGRGQVMARGPGGLGWSFDWLPDGTLLTTGAGLNRVVSGAEPAPFADVTALAADWNEIVVDGRGNVYVNGGNFAGSDGRPGGVLALVRPDGTTESQADGLAFPNGMAVTPDNSTLIVAESWSEQLSAWDIALDGTLSERRVWARTPDDHPDGICADAEGAVWYADVGRQRCVRVREGGEIQDVVEVDRGAFACMLGGEDRRTLYILAAEWGGFERVPELLTRRTGQVLAMTAPVAGAGWP
jgi:sugar lactone lactonase YvrE